MIGQTHHFRQYAPEKIAYAIDRYTRNLVSRLKHVVLPAPFGPISACIWPRSSGSTGSTVAGCSGRSATFHPPKPRHATTQQSVSPPWRCDSQSGVSGNLGAVHTSAWYSPLIGLGQVIVTGVADAAD